MTDKKEQSNDYVDYRPPSYLFVGRFLCHYICNHLRESVEQAKWEESTTFGGDSNKRTSKLKWLDNETTPGLLDIIKGRSVLAANLLGVSVWPESMLKIQVSRYQEGQEYNWHTDLDATRTHLQMDRKLSAVISLCNGGKLELEQFGAFNLNVGDAIVFPSFLNHRRPPVQSGEGVKFSLAVWLPGPAWS